MSNDTALWDKDADGVYIVLVRATEGEPEVWSDPRISIEDAANDLGDVLLDDCREEAAVLLIGPDGGERLTVRDVTGETVSLLRRRLEERGLDRVVDPSPLRSAAPIVAHLARWADREYGALSRSLPASKEQEVREAVKVWMERWGDYPENRDVTGILIRVSNDNGSWSVEVIDTIPAPQPEPRPEM